MESKLLPRQSRAYQGEKMQRCKGTQTTQVSPLSLRPLKGGRHGSLPMPWPCGVNQKNAPTQSLLLRSARELLEDNKQLILEKKEQKALYQTARQNLHHACLGGTSTEELKRVGAETDRRRSCQKRGHQGRISASTPRPRQQPAYRQRTRAKGPCSESWRQQPRSCFHHAGKPREMAATKAAVQSCDRKKGGPEGSSEGCSQPRTAEAAQEQALTSFLEPLSFRAAHLLLPFRGGRDNCQGQSGTLNPQLPTISLDFFSLRRVFARPQGCTSCTLPDRLLKT